MLLFLNLIISLFLDLYNFWYAYPYFSQILHHVCHLCVLLTLMTCAIISNVLSSNLYSQAISFLEPPIFLLQSELMAANQWRLEYSFIALLACIHWFLEVTSSSSWFISSLRLSTVDAFKECMRAWILTDNMIRYEIVRNHFSQNC